MRWSPPTSPSNSAERFVPAAVGLGMPPDAAKGDVEAGLASADRRIEATYDTPPQYHNAMEPHAVVAQWDGRQPHRRHPEPGHGAGARPPRRPVRHRARQHPHPQPVPGRRLRLQGRGLGPAGAGHHGGAARRPAGEAGDPTRADVRPGRPSGGDPADHAPRRRCGRRAHRAGPSHAHRLQHLRRLLRAERRPVASPLCEPDAQDLLRGGPPRHRDAVLHARARRGLGQPRAGRAPSTRWRMPAAWTPWTSA